MAVALARTRSGPEPSPPVDGELVLVERARVGDAGGEHGGAVGVGRGDRELQGRRQVVDADRDEVAARLQPVGRPRAEHDLAVLQGDEGVVGLVAGRGEAGDDLPRPVGRVAVDVLGCGVQGDEAALVDVEVGPGVDERGAVGGDGDALLDDGLGAVFEGGGGGAEGVVSPRQRHGGFEHEGARRLPGERRARGGGDRRAAVHRHGERAQLRHDEAGEEVGQVGLVRHLLAAPAGAVRQLLQGAERPGALRRAPTTLVDAERRPVGGGEGVELRRQRAGHSGGQVALVRPSIRREQHPLLRVGDGGERGAGGGGARGVVGAAAPLPDGELPPRDGGAQVGVEGGPADIMVGRAVDEEAQAGERVDDVGVAVLIEVGRGRRHALHAGGGPDVDGLAVLLERDDADAADAPDRGRLVHHPQGGLQLAVEHGAGETVAVRVAAGGLDDDEGRARHVDRQHEADVGARALAAERHAALHPMFALAQRRAGRGRLDAQGDRRAAAGERGSLGERGVGGGRRRVGAQAARDVGVGGDACGEHERAEEQPAGVHEASHRGRPRCAGSSPVRRGGATAGGGVMQA